MQHGILEKLGFDKDFGVECLNKVTQDFRNDQEVATKFQYFGACANLSCQEAAFTELERKEFYSHIPPMMHSFPHIWMVQNQMALQRQQQMTQQQATKSNTNIDALKQSGLLSLMGNPEGRLKVQALGARIQASKTKVEEETAAWSKDKKAAFFESFGEHPVVDTLNACNDPLEKINTFVEMSDADMNSMITLMMVLASEDGQAILHEEKSKSISAGNSDGMQYRMSAVNSIISTMGSLTNLKFSNPNQQQQHQHNKNCEHNHGHDHGHSHEHDDNCQLHGHGHQSADVSTGFAAKMDR
jgi:hypothetical protein